MRILLVEDEPDLNGLIVRKLKLENYTVDSCLNGLDALDYLETEYYDAVILDTMIPGVSGMELVKKVRSQGKKTPILLMTADDTALDRGINSELQVDEYLLKPFALQELLTKVRAMLRRYYGNISNIFEVGDLIVNCDARRVMRNQKIISLSSKEFSILEYLIRNTGVVLSREKISQHIWKYDYEGESNMIDVYIRYLRKKIDEGQPVKLIHTVRGVGYVLRVPGIVRK
ncbi:response regulator transcription factor [Lacrimispora defluvii]|uniref:Stage 0 sporulation protein A homolog n=1 Tax=Lacrimispora defluvii TaxID=2719233 RepID=A0ABX1VQ55_9FIRM|nr:response regulator transcription factor [Lacrimispora defluvii]